MIIKYFTHGNSQSLFLLFLLAFLLNSPNKPTSLCIWVTIQTLFLDPHFQKLESVSLGWDGIFADFMADSAVQPDLLAQAMLIAMGCHLYRLQSE